MSRFTLCLALILTAVAGYGQGISYVTRRTPTQQSQTPARQFFDAAGIDVTGGGGVAGPSSFAGGVAGPSPAGVRRPVVQPMLSNRSPAPAGQARPYVLGPMKPGAGTNTAAVAAKPLLPPKSQTAVRRP